MKKITMVLLALAVLFGFIGCGDDSSSGSGDNSGSGGGGYPTYTRDDGLHTLTFYSATEIIFDLTYEGGGGGLYFLKDLSDPLKFSSFNKVQHVILDLLDGPSIHVDHTGIGITPINDLSGDYTKQ